MFATPICSKIKIFKALELVSVDSDEVEICFPLVLGTVPFLWIPSANPLIHGSSKSLHFKAVGWYSSQRVLYYLLLFTC